MVGLAGAVRGEGTSIIHYNSPLKNILVLVFKSTTFTPVWGCKGSEKSAPTREKNLHVDRALVDYQCTYMYIQWNLANPSL